MRKWLLFQLYGAMSSWGDVAVGEMRGSETHPGRSALIGMVAAAIGVRRDQEELLHELGGAYRFAVEVRSSGHFLRDYHTAQVPERSALKRQAARTRRDELMVSRDKLGTILSTRDYRCDAYYRILVDAAGHSDWTLDRLESALREPTFPLYLGRKSCPPALPLAPRIVEAPTIVQALSKTAPDGPDQVMHSRFLNKTARIDSEQTLALYWEEGMEAGIEPDQSFSRRDQPRTRARWQFDQRRENFVRIARGKEPCT